MSDDNTVTPQQFSDLMTPHCVYPACEHKAAMYPRILLWQAKFGLNKPRDRAAIFPMQKATYCAECAAKMKAKDFLNDQAWLLVERKFKAAGLVTPRKWTAVLEWVAIEILTPTQGFHKITKIMHGDSVLYDEKEK